MTDRYKGKLFSVLGDSISTLGGCSEPFGAEFYGIYRSAETGVALLEDTWWGRVISELGAELLVNNSISGSTVAKHPSCTYPSYGASDERTAALDRGGLYPDVIMVFMGANDRGYGMKPAPTDGAEREDLAVFSVAYRVMLGKLKKNYPAAEIWCLTLPVTACSRIAGFSFPYRYGGAHIDEYCKEIRAAAVEYGCRLIDLFAETEKSPCDTLEGLHPNSDGMMKIADAALSLL